MTILLFVYLTNPYPLMIHLTQHRNSIQISLVSNYYIVIFFIHLIFIIIGIEKLNTFIFINFLLKILSKFKIIYLCTEKK
jgi:hypothetical protein